MQFGVYLYGQNVRYNGKKTNNIDLTCNQYSNNRMTNGSDMNRPCRFRLESFITPSAAASNSLQRAVFYGH